MRDKLEQLLLMRDNMRNRVRVIAVVLAGAMVGACGRSAEEYAKRADQYVAQKKYADAIIDYRNAVQKKPQLGPVRLRLADAYAQIGDMQHAYGEYIRAADLLPNDNEAQLKAGAMLLMANRLAEAKAKAQLVLRRSPRNAGALMLLGNALAGTNDLEGAIDSVQQAIAVSPDTGSAYSNLAALQLARGDKELAEASFKKAVNASPKSTTARVALAHFYRSQGRDRDAEAALKTAVAVDPQDVAVNANLADLYLRSGRVAEAEAPIRAIAAKMPSATAQLMLAEYYIKARRTQEAVAILQKVAQDKDQYAIATARLAALDYSEGRAAAAHKALDEILAREPKSSTALLMKAKILALEHQYASALPLAKAAEHADSSSEPLLVEAQIHLDLGQLEEAENGFKQVLSMAPQSVPAQVSLSRLEATLGNTKTALEYARQAAAATPGSADVRLTYAAALVDAGDFAAAARELRDLQDRFPRSSNVQVQIARLALAQRDTATAKAAYSNALRLDSSSADALDGLVNLDLQAHDAGTARTRVEARTAVAPRDGRAWFVAAHAYFAGGDLVRAEQALLKTIEFDPGNPAAFAQLGALYARQHRNADAVAQFRKMAAQRPRSVGVHTMLGVLLGDQQKRDESVKEFQRALEIDPNAPVAANDLAWLYSEQGENLDTALQLAQVANAAIPNEPSILDTLGWVEYKKDLVAEAIQHLSQAVAKEDGNASYQFHLGMAYAKNGDDHEASVTLKRALSLQPQFEGADAAKEMLGELSALAAD